MNIVVKNVKELKPYDKNPRKNKKAIDKVSESIKMFGFKVPIVIDNNNVVITGHTRLEACKKLSLSKVPCIIADDLTDEQIRAFRIADNRVSEYSDWDFDLLNSELATIENLDLSFLDFENIDDIFSDDIPMDTYETKPYTKEHFLLTFDRNDEEGIRTLLDFIERQGWEYEQSHN